jgi:hypothetical protein
VTGLLAVHCMTTTLAHFTAAELPGTAAILLTGLGIGLAVRTTRSLALWLSAAAVVCLGTVAALADHVDWASSLAHTPANDGWDWLWLVAAAVFACLAGSRTDSRGAN